MARTLEDEQWPHSIGDLQLRTPSVVAPIYLNLEVERFGTGILGKGTEMM